MKKPKYSYEKRVIMVSKSVHDGAHTIAIDFLLFKSMAVYRYVPKKDMISLTILGRVSPSNFRAGSVLSLTKT